MIRSASPRQHRLCMRAGGVVGIAGVSGNGQQELLAALSGEDRARRRQYPPVWQTTLRAAARRDKMPAGSTSCLRSAWAAARCRPCRWVQNGAGKSRGRQDHLRRREARRPLRLLPTSSRNSTSRRRSKLGEAKSSGRQLLAKTFIVAARSQTQSAHRLAAHLGRCAGARRADPPRRRAGRGPRRAGCQRRLDELFEGRDRMHVIAKRRL